MAFVTYSELKIGLLVLLCFVLVMVMTIAVGDIDSVFRRKTILHIMIPSVVGLELYSQVTYSGVRIGKVNRIDYDEQLDRVVLSAQVDFNSPVATDSEVQITSAGLLSPPFVEIKGGSPEKRIKTLVESGQLDGSQPVQLTAKPYLALGEIISVVGNSVEQIQGVAGDLKGVLSKVERVLDTLHGPIEEIAGLVDHVSGEFVVTVAEVKDLIFELRPKIRDAIDQMNGLIQNASQGVIASLNNIKQGTERFPVLMADAQKGIGELLHNANGLIQSVSPEIKTIAGDIQTVLRDVRSRLEQIETSLTTFIHDIDHVVVDNRTDIDQLIANLKETSEHLNDLSQQLSKNPWRIVWKTESRQEPHRVSPDWDPFMIETSEP